MQICALSSGFYTLYDPILVLNLNGGATSLRAQEISTNQKPCSQNHSVPPREIHIYTRFCAELVRRHWIRMH